MNLQFRQVEAVIAVAKIGGLGQTHGPRRHPPPEVAGRMFLEPVASRFHCVIDKPTTDHLVGRHDIEEVGVVAQFQMIVGSRSGSATELETGIPEGRQDGPLDGTGVIFENSRVVN